MGHRKVAIIGARGVANYGGFETVVAELAPGLVARGYEVYCSHRRLEHECGQSYRGARILYFPLRFPRSNRIGRMFEILYDWYFVLRCAFFLKCDTICCLGIAAGPILPLARLSGARIAVNLDGLEWKRQKFHLLERSYIRAAFISSFISAQHLIIDNGQLRRFIPKRYQPKVVLIPYGVTLRDCPGWNPSLVGQYLKEDSASVAPGRYWLVVARLEPENNIRAIVEAYGKSASRLPLVVVGSYSSSRFQASVDEAIRSLPEGKSVLLMGSIFNRDHLDMLRCNCLAYVHGHSVGGTNPSLLEAMSLRNIVIAHDNDFNREVAGDSVMYFRGTDDLAGLLDSVEARPKDFEELGAKAYARVGSSYRWEDIVDAYCRLFEGQPPNSE